LRLALLTEIPAPFRIPLFNALASRLELRVYFLAERDPRRPHYEAHAEERRFDAVTLPGRELRRGGRWVVLSRGVGRSLRAFRPDVVVIGGWNQPAFWHALAHARLRRIPLVTWVESTGSDARRGIRPLELAKRVVLRSSAAFLVPGTASAQYLRSLGVGDDRLAVAPNAVDASVFTRAAVDRSERDETTFLYVGRFDREKGLDVLLDAFDRVPGRLVLAGGGPVEPELRARAVDRVTFAGRRGRDELPELYAAADVFVLPSLSEPWGMVLNEAATAGLPLVATEAAGAAHDLVEQGENGFRVPPGDAHALADAMERLAVDPALRARASRRSRELAAQFTPDAWADAVAALARRLAG
jgi:glycosyltransferase involved in cell wall biosynthesis